MKGFNYGAEENIFIFIDNCSDDSLTNMPDYKNEIRVTYYANKLHLISKTEEKVLISINNSLGQQINIEEYKLNKNDNIIDLNIGKGFYIINIYSEKTKYLNYIKIIVK